MGGCTWTGKTEFKETFSSIPWPNSVISGVESWFHGLQSDRKYKFKLCSLLNVDSETKLQDFSWRNEALEPLDVNLPADEFFGVFESEFNPAARDRSFKFGRLKLSVCSAR